MTTTVVNIKTDEYDIKCCREPDGRILPVPAPSCLGNPFHLTNPNDDLERAEVIRRFKDYFYARLVYDPIFKEYVISLKGKRLGCFCKRPDKFVACHGDIIKEYLDGLGD